MEVGQIFANTFEIVLKNHDPSSIRAQKSNTRKYDAPKKIISYDLGHNR